jgi:hypothetical protein
MPDLVKRRPWRWYEMHQCPMADECFTPSECVEFCAHAPHDVWENEDEEEAMSPEDEDYA